MYNWAPSYAFDVPPLCKSHSFAVSLMVGLKFPTYNWTDCSPHRSVYPIISRLRSPPPRRPRARSVHLIITQISLTGGIDGRSPSVHLYPWTRRHWTVGRSPANRRPPRIVPLYFVLRPAAVENGWIPSMLLLFIAGGVGREMERESGGTPRRGWWWWPFYKLYGGEDYDRFLWWGVYLT